MMARLQENPNRYATIFFVRLTDWRVPRSKIPSWVACPFSEKGGPLFCVVAEL